MSSALHASAWRACAGRYEGATHSSSGCGGHASGASAPPSPEPAPPSPPVPTPVELPLLHATTAIAPLATHAHTIAESAFAATPSSSGPSSTAKKRRSPERSLAARGSFSFTAYAAARASRHGTQSGPATETFWHVLFVGQVDPPSIVHFGPQKPERPPFCEVKPATVASFAPVSVVGRFASHVEPVGQATPPTLQYWAQ